MATIHATLERESVRFPLVVDLARHLSIAARIEPALLRAMRLRAFRAAGVTLESDLWFSPLVQVREPAAMVLRQDVREALHEELKEPAHAISLERAWNVIRRVHEGAPPVMRLEEEVTYLALARRLTEMERFLGGALDTLLKDQTDGVARWAARALGRLPKEARESAPALALARAASIRLDGIPVRGTIQADGEAWSTDLLRAIGTTLVGVRIVAVPPQEGNVPARGVLEIREIDSATIGSQAPQDGSAQLDVPRTRPLVVDVLTPTDQGWREHRQALAAGGVTTVDVPLGPAIKIRNLVGHEIRIKPESTDRRSRLTKGHVGPDLGHLFDLESIWQPALDLGWVMDEAQAPTSQFPERDDPEALAEAKSLGSVLRSSDIEEQLPSLTRAYLIRRDEERFAEWFASETAGSRAPTEPSAILPEEPFHGRAEVLGRLRDFRLQVTGPAVMTITGAAGLGKSAILRQYVRQFDPSKGILIYHAFDDDVPDADTLGSLLAAAVPGWNRFDPLNHLLPGRDRLQTLADRMEASGAISRAAPLVLVVDGLDGPDKDDDPLGRLAALLPGRLASCLLILTSARTVSPGERIGVVHVLDLDEAQWQQSNHEVVAEIWRRAGADVAESDYFDRAKVGRREGNARVAGMLIRALKQRQEQIGLEGIEHGLRGVVQLVQRSIGELPAPSLRQLAHTVLEFLAVAREPFPVSLLQREDLSLGDVQQVVKALVPLLRDAEPTGDVGWYYPLVLLDRSSLVAALAQAIPTLDRRRGHAALLAELRRFVDSPSASGYTWASDYLAKYSIRHLAGAEQDMAAYCRKVDNLAAMFHALGYERGRQELEWLDGRQSADGWEEPIPSYRRIIDAEEHWLRRAPGALTSILWNQLRIEGRDLENPAIALEWGFEDKTLLRLVRPLGRLPTDNRPPIFTGHTASVVACAIASASPRIVSASRDGTVRMGDVNGGGAVLVQHEGAMSSCAVSADGAVIVAGAADGTVYRRNPADRRRDRIWSGDKGHAGAVTVCAVFERRDCFITGGVDGLVRAWPLGTESVGRETIVVGDHGVVACTIADSDVISVHTNGAVLVTDLQTGSAVRQWRIDPPVACAFVGSPPILLAWHLDRPPTRLILQTGDVEAPAGTDHHDGLNAALTAFATTDRPRSSVASAEGRNILLHRPGDEQPRTLYGHRETVRSLAFGTLEDRSVLLSASEDNTLKLWDTDTGREIATLGLYGLANRLLAAASVTGFPGIPIAAAGNVMTPTPVLAYPSERDTVAVHDLERDVVVMTHTLAPRPAGLLFTLDHVIAAVLDDGQVALIGQRPTEVVMTPSAETVARVTAVAGHRRTSTLVIGGSDGKLVFHHLTIGNGAVAAAHDGAVRCLAISPDGKQLLAGGDDGRLRLWDPIEARQLRTLIGPSTPYSACAFAPDGRAVITGSATGAVDRIDLSTNEVTRLDAHTAAINACMLMTRGDAAHSLVTASDDGTLNVYDYPAGRKVKTLEGHTRSVTGCLALPGETHFVSWSLDRTLKLWNIETLGPIATLYGSAPFVSVTVVPSADEPRLAALDANGMVWILGVDVTSRTAASSAAPVRVGGDIKPPARLRYVEPNYPPIAMSAGAQGLVVLEVAIAASGDVSSAKVLRSIPLLDQAAVDAVLQWKYEPTVISGTPTSVITTATVEFFPSSKTT